MNVNKAIIAGRLTREVEVRTLPSGTQVGNFSLAVNDYYTKKDGEKVEEVQFFNCSIFGKMVETLSKYAVKGQVILVEGKIKISEYEKKDGSKDKAISITVSTFHFGAKPQGAGRTAGEAVVEAAHENGEVRLEDIPF